MCFFIISDAKIAEKSETLKKKHYFRTMKLKNLLFIMAALPTMALAQQTRSFSEAIQTPRIVVADDPLLPPIASMNDVIEISFDKLSHAYTRYIYKVEFCNADWTPAEDVFESDWLAGFNERPIDDYETSFNTTVLYTHYSFSIPNDDVRLLLPGNYRVSIYEDGEDEAVMEACFSLLRPSMTIDAEVSSNTDVDFNQHNQQVTYRLNYRGAKVSDPERELHTVVMQNRRLDNAVIDLAPNIRSATGVEWNHRRELIFPAGNEFHKFELLDVRRNGMGIDRMEWYDPQYHATLYSVSPARNYTYDQDVDGAYIIRQSGDEENDTQCEYAFVHFLLKTPQFIDGDVYVCGLWNNGFPDERCRMHYDEKQGAYETGVLLKQGYYNYQFRLLSADGTWQTRQTEGDFYQTENEYIILVYHRPQGERYDALVGYRRMKSNGNN